MIRGLSWSARYHEKVWPEITKSLKDAVVGDAGDHLLGTRMFAIMEGTGAICEKGRNGFGEPESARVEELMEVSESAG